MQRETTIALITGSSRGIGRAVARKLAEAGIFVYINYREQEADWDRLINTNLKGVFNCCQAVSRPMIKQKRGRIVYITSYVLTADFICEREHGIRRKS